PAHAGARGRSRPPSGPSPCPDDPLVAEQPRHLARAEARDLGGVEACERLPVRGALAEDRLPRKARLRALEHEEFEKISVPMLRHAPLLVVVGAERFALRPGAPYRLAA